ncbi:uncharacterized protein KD926_006496 [Aspergillus affinis]|uniref:uncharacterized protein n=1 Tax=Aspergillus affinis TaxID=1070780 RepID=UPI0022FEC502|nr:uncharacterized protein KD926_006496 [Aspergillus affinis]KAI9041772.1 hypothetical protein KD926_006496 [Aspergillus affinis]
MESVTPEEREALLQGPAATPPPGMQSNLTNPPNQKAASYFIIIFFGLLATFALVVRIYTRALILRRVKVADYSLILGWVGLPLFESNVSLTNWDQLMFVAYLVSGWLAADASPMVDQWNLRLKDFIDLLFRQRFYVGSAFYGMCMFFTKIAILLNILEIFWSDETLSRTCHILMWANGIFYIVFTFIQIFSCRPISRSWDVFIANGTCLNTRLITLVAGAINAASDLLILILPQRRIWGLHSPLRKKLAVSGLFSLGLLYVQYFLPPFSPSTLKLQTDPAGSLVNVNNSHSACIASIVRLAYSIITSQTSNRAYYGYLAGTWAVPEMSFGIMVAGFPVLPKFISHIQEKSPIAKWRNSARNARLGSSFTGRRSTSAREGPSDPASSARGRSKGGPKDPDQHLLITSPSVASIGRSSDGMC